MNIGRISLFSLLLPLAALSENPQVLVNPQGLAQQNLSIRGSSYAGAGISINGLNLKVPYSAHYNAELPLHGPLLSDAAARAGMDNLSGHLIGTSALVFSPLEPQSSITAAAGTKERYRASTFGSSENIGGYIDWEKARRIDHDANDLERFTGGAVVQFMQNDWQFDILSASQTKRYGAQGYYGIPANVHAENRTEDTLLLGSAFKGDLDGAFMRAGTSLREFNEEYRLPSSGFASDTLSRHGSLMLEGRTLEIQDIALNLRGDLEHERLGGDIGSHHRTRGSILILPEMRLERVTIKAGLNSVFQTDEAAEWLPQAGIDFFATDNIKLHAAYSENVQQPDYQTLYYSDPYRTGNPFLQQQKSRNIELGLHQYLSARLDWRAGIFHRRLENASDWVKTNAADTAWAATGLGSLDVSGFDAALNYRSSGDLGFQLYYQWVAKDDYDFHAGLYELDYPEHLLAFTGQWRISSEFLLFAAQTLRYQTANPARSGNDFGADASLGLHCDPRFANNVRLSFLVENLWDSNFQAMPGLKPRPLSVSTGITASW